MGEDDVSNVGAIWGLLQSALRDDQPKCIATYTKDSATFQCEAQPTQEYRLVLSDRYLGEGLSLSVDVWTCDTHHFDVGNDQRAQQPHCTWPHFTVTKVDG
jgi:hypothetical protein